MPFATNWFLLLYIFWKKFVCKIFNFSFSADIKQKVHNSTERQNFIFYLWTETIITFNYTQAIMNMLPPVFFLEKTFWRLSTRLGVTSWSWRRKKQKDEEPEKRTVCYKYFITIILPYLETLLNKKTLNRKILKTDRPFNSNWVIVLKP